MYLNIFVKAFERKYIDVNVGNNLGHCQFNGVICTNSKLKLEDLKLCKICWVLQICNYNLKIYRHDKP